jgi:hypothetical protein
MESNLKFDEVTDTAVKTYVELIIAAAKNYKFEIEIDVDYNEATDRAGKKAANSANIVSELGVVIVLPDFKKKSARATTYNIGLSRAMLSEGYEEEYIDKEGKVFGALMPISQSNADIFGFFLTHKLDPLKLNKFRNPNKKSVDDAEN